MATRVPSLARRFFANDSVQFYTTFAVPVGAIVGWIGVGVNSHEPGYKEWRQRPFHRRLAKRASGALAGAIIFPVVAPPLAGGLLLHAIATSI